MPAWIEWPKDGQFFVNVSSRLGCLFWGRVERGESNAKAMGDSQTSHWVFMVLISLKCQPGLRSCTRLFYKRLSLQSSDLDKISLLPVLARKVRRSIILTEAVAVHILTRHCNTNLHIFTFKPPSCPSCSHLQSKHSCFTLKCYWAKFLTAGDQIK